MVEKMTAVWLIILTIVVCAAVPGVLIYTTSLPPKMLTGLPLVESTNHVLALSQ
ncbi:hypothetical protein [Nitrososphaera viennensis]|uniref:Uncharacterized protein n=2 Tax=Nitrososphaera viennensis TaxID=1034015 RepID=A0A060HMH2_9ARCH|nr:hypothetical protein [Nitrososphaera viennensis]AIC14771.1 hypothetical protein NVIE_005710 [Nitrososphaera viennensis EN76]UVS69727.1 hypothetical protein NWT39_02815 [Nitrososphaera viennensis]